jgi:hypothetical protein
VGLILFLKVGPHFLFLSSPPPLPQLDGLQSLHYNQSPLHMAALVCTKVYASQQRNSCIHEKNQFAGGRQAARWWAFISCAGAAASWASIFGGLVLDGPELKVGCYRI